MVGASGNGHKRARQVEPLLIDSNGAVVDGPDASGLLVLRGAVPGMARTIANDFSRSVRRRRPASGVVCAGVRLGHICESTY